MDLFRKLPLIFLLFFTFSSATLFAQTTFDFSQRKVFVENKGQFKAPAGQTANILYAYDEGTSKIYFTSKGLIYSFNNVTVKKDADKSNSIGEEEEEEHNVKTQSDIVTMEWEGCNPDCQINAEDKTPDYYSYSYKKEGKENNINNISGYKKITYKNLYPGIDVEYVFHPKEGIEYSMIVHPGADVSVVKMKYPLDQDVSRKEGNIHIKTLFGDIIDHAPSTYYTNNINSTISSSFVHWELNEVTFRLGDYDHSKGITIDPWTITPSFPNSNKIWNCQSDALGNVYLYGGDTPLLLRKYTSTGTLLWTYTTPWDSSTYWLGTLITDRAGDSYITSGANGEISRITTAGALVWHNNPNGIFGPLYEYWHLAFNCDQTQLVVGGTELPSPFNTAGFRGAIFNINLTNGNILNQVYVGYPFGLLNSSINEVRSICSSLNGNFYYLTLDSIGSATTALAVNYQNNNSYNFAYGSPNYTVTGNMGQNNIKANMSDIYTQNGTNVHERNITTGAIIATATIPGGTSTSFLGSYSPGNSGIDIDSCGNVYVGSSNQVVKYDGSLNQLATYTTPSAVYDVNVNVNGEVIACGDGFATSIAFSACKPSAPICRSCTPAVITPVTTNIKCNGSATGSATANITGNNPPYTYAWTPSGGTNQTASGLSAGTYTCTVTDVSGCSASASFVITQPAAITATITPTSAACNTTGSASVSAGGGTGVYTYSWSPSGQTSANATGLAAGTYTLTITDANSCTYTSSTIINSTGGPTATPLQNNILCNGNSTGNATANVSGGATPYTYSWSPGGGTNSSVSALSAGTYTCTITDAVGCFTTMTITITQPTALSVIYQSDSLCSGDSIRFAGTISGGSHPYTFSWTPVTGLSCNNCLAPRVSPSVSTCYTVTVSDSNGCTSTAKVCAKVNQLPDVTLIIQSTDTVCSNSAIIKLFGGPNGGTYGGTAVYGHFFYPDSAVIGKYNTFYYTYTDGSGCNATIWDSIYVQSCEGINSLTGNNGNIKIYPNPNNGQFTVQLSGISSRFSVEIYDVLGQDIMSEELNAKSTLVDLRNQANGVYFYRILKQDGSMVGVGKLVIQK